MAALNLFFFSFSFLKITGAPAVVHVILIAFSKLKPKQKYDKERSLFYCVLFCLFVLFSYQLNIFSSRSNSEPFHFWIQPNSPCTSVRFNVTECITKMSQLSQKRGSLHLPHAFIREID